MDNLSDLETSEKILDVLELVNPSIAKLFTLELKKKVSKKRWFAPQEYYNRKFNYYGLLEGGIMKGIEYEDIAYHIIIDYFSKHFNPNWRKKFPQHEKRREKVIKILEDWGINTEQEEIEIE